MGEEKRKPGRPRKKPLEETPGVTSEAKASLTMSQKTGEQLQKLSLENIQRNLTGLFQEVLGPTYKNKDSGIFNLNYYNPFLQNERLKQITASAITYTPEELSDFLKSPSYHEQELKEASASLSATQYLYYKILREAADIPMFKYFVVPPVLKKEEYQKDDFLKEEEFVDEWLQTFDLVNTLKRISLEVKREGKPSYLFRQSLSEKDGKKVPCYVAWQKLPPRYVKLTAIGEHGYITSFNLMIFLQPAFFPSQYPDFIQRIWKEMNQSGIIVKNKENQSVPDLNKLRKFSYTDYAGKQAQGTLEVDGDRYMYWVQLPQDMCFSFASDTSNVWSVPDTIGLFNSLQELTDYSTLAGLIASTPLTAVLTGQAEYTKDAQVGQDQTCMSPQTMEAFKNSFDSMVSGNIAAFLAPFKDLKLQSLPNVPNSSDIKTKAVQNFISSAGEGGLIAATDKPSVAMSKGMQLMSGSQYDFVTKQFQTIINDNLKRHAGLKYKWRVVLWGDIFTFENAVKTMKELVASGASFLLPKLASAYDLSMRDVRGLGDYMEAFKIYDKFKPFNYSTLKLNSKVTVNEKGATSNPVGRPSMDDGEVENDNTAASKDAGNDVSEVKDFASQGLCVLCGNPVEDGHVLCADCEEEFGVEDSSYGQ